MWAPVDFDCEGCGLLLSPGFEVGAQACAAGCGESVWTCGNCGRKQVVCGACEPARRAKLEAEEERRLAALDDMRGRKLAEGRPPGD